MTSEGNNLQTEVTPYLGQLGPEVYSRTEVTKGLIWNFLEPVEDANPVHWDEEYARRSSFGRLIAPPSMIWTVFMDHWWAPDYVREAQRQAIQTQDVEDWPDRVMSVVRDHGYTVGLNVTREDEFIDPYGPGDGRLKARTRVAEVSEEKHTAVGRGVFVTTEIEYRAEKDDRLVVIGRNVLLMYNPSEPRSN